MIRLIFIFSAFVAALAFSACDRGNQLFEQAREAEEAGDLEEARAHYLAIVRLLPDSEQSETARSSFVEISLDMAEQALEEGDINRANHILRQVEPLYEQDEGPRVTALAAGIHEALESDTDAAVADERTDAVTAVTEPAAP